jgi:hypothetical protein
VEEIKSPIAILKETALTIVSPVGYVHRQARNH